MSEEYRLGRALSSVGLSSSKARELERALEREGCVVVDFGLALQLERDAQAGKTATRRAAAVTGDAEVLLAAVILAKGSGGRLKIAGKHLGAASGRRVAYLQDPRSGDVELTV